MERKDNLISSKLGAKIGASMRESLVSVLPISIIILVLCFTVVKVNSGVFLAAAIGAVFLVIGMGLFNLGIESSMNFMGNYIGTNITKSKNVLKIALISLLVGVMITVSEPDLSVLATNIFEIAQIPKFVIIGAVGIGTGAFLVIAMLRIVFGIKLKYLLWGSYILLFVLACFIKPDFWAIAFDSGGVTTGPMTVPFIMTLGVGVSSMRIDKNGEQDSFGLVSLCSIGPIISVLIIGLIYSNSIGAAGSIAYGSSYDWANMTTSISLHYLTEFPSYMLEVLISVTPIFIFFVIYQALTDRVKLSEMIRIVIGVATTMMGLTIFLTGANVGFMPIGYILGNEMGSSSILIWLTVPIGMLVGYFIVKAEPAVHVLTEQVAEITSGAVSTKAIMNTLCIGVSVSVGLSFVRILTGISIMYFLIPGYAIALILSLFAPNVFVSIAFDSGGVASGPMTATFLLSLAIGVCTARGGNIMTDAFGTIAMVAMTPLIAIQILGIVFKVRSERTVAEGNVAFKRLHEQVIDL